MPSTAALDVVTVSTLFKALGDETRLRIVALLSHGELCVCHIESTLQLSQPKASRHLAVLKNAGVVESRRQGSWVYYRLLKQRDPRRDRQLGLVVGEFVKATALKRDLARLTKTLGPNACR